MKILMLKDGKVVDMKKQSKTKTPITAERPIDHLRKDKSLRDLQKSPTS
jgi:hypothetical protein